MKSKRLLTSLLALLGFTSVSAQTQRDHYAPGVTATEGLGQSVAINGKYILAGRPGFSGNTGDAVVFDAVTGKLLRKIQPPDLADRSAGDDFGYAVALRGEEAIISAPSDTTGALAGASGSIYFFNLRTGALRTKVSSIFHL